MAVSIDDVVGMVIFVMAIAMFFVFLGEDIERSSSQLQNTSSVLETLRDDAIESLEITYHSFPFFVNTNNSFEGVVRIPYDFEDGVHNSAVFVSRGDSLVPIYVPEEMDVIFFNSSFINGINRFTLFYFESLEFSNREALSEWNNTFVKDTLFLLDEGGSMPFANPPQNIGLDSYGAFSFEVQYVNQTYGGSIFGNRRSLNNQVLAINWSGKKVLMPLLVSLGGVR